MHLTSKQRRRERREERRKAYISECKKREAIVIPENITIKGCNCFPMFSFISKKIIA